MIGWIARLALMMGGAVAGWFVAKDAPNFSVIQGVAAMLIIAAVVAVLAFWPTRPKRRSDGTDGS
jgi:hypothetical protein